ncbi:FAD-dependent oxidoreductase [Tistrella bauzanensis]|uniref:FAD-dependent oxidoreductase n=1 Tax=Tistrella bauzanensis TaxID=657419 RepID=A0ABQ1IIY1_9PROT|nr:FAD-dependent oxidoreductase [Tistrella bauzanensis]
MGLTLALRLARLGIDTTLIEARSGPLRQGSKALCVQHAALTILDQLGAADDLVAEGRPWYVSRTRIRDIDVALKRFQAPDASPLPPFLNIQQWRTEELLLDRVRRTGRTRELWSRRVTGLVQSDQAVTLMIDGPDGPEHLRARYVIGADGIRSQVREAAGIPWLGYSHADRFLIVDIDVGADLPHERQFLFDAPSNPGRQIVIHPQPGTMWRFDWQLPPDADVEAEQADGRLDARIRAIAGDRPWRIEWLSTYRFHQRRAAAMRKGRVLLAGDAAHAFPPFGARGMNSGIQDADNLAWKLKLVLDGHAAPRLLDSYDVERGAAARDNLAITEATIRFMVPPDRARRAWRNGLLTLARHWPPARAWVNSGRMSEPNRYPVTDDGVLVAGAGRAGSGRPQPGLPAPDAPVLVAGHATRLRQVMADAVLLLLLVGPDGAELVTAATAVQRALDATLPQVSGIAPGMAPTIRVACMPPTGAALHGLPDGVLHVDDRQGMATVAYAGRDPTLFALRPDGYVGGVVTQPDAATVIALIMRVLALNDQMAVDHGAVDHGNAGRSIGADGTTEGGGADGSAAAA